MLCSYMCMYVDVGDVYIVCGYGFVCAGHGYTSCPYYAYVGSDWILYGTCLYVRYLGLPGWQTILHGQSASWAFCFSVLLGGIVFGMFFGSSVTLT